MLRDDRSLAGLPRALAPLVEVRHVAMIGNYPPRRCGIATFTSDVRSALVAAREDLTCDVIAMRDAGDDNAYPAEVAFTVRQDVRADYLEAARRIDASGAEVICVQHEFGIFGGPAGEHVLTLLDHASLPVVSVLHTILESPDADQRRVFERLIARSERVIVMAERGREMLLRVWGVDPEKISLIAHGAPDEPLVETAPAKAELGYEGRELLFTFGLLSPGKGIETAIRALPAIVAARPQALYLVLGATHPHLKSREGEAYRDSLVRLAEELGVSEHVQLLDSYTDTPRLLQYLRAADVYVTPYLNEAQITSGTLSYAAALGKPVVSTPYWHAQELLADGAGLLTPFGDSAAMAAAVIGLLSHPERLEAMRRRIYDATRSTVWSALAEAYLTDFRAVRGGARVLDFRKRRAAVRRPRPEPALAGVRRMTDACGMLQHSLWSLPDRNHGYCVDDNARALILMHRLPGEPDEARRALTSTYAAFVQHAWNEGEGAFRNFMSYERTWLETKGSEDSCARAFWSVAVTAAEAHQPDHRRWAQALLPRLLGPLSRLSAPRAEAFIVLGLASMAAAGVATPEMHRVLQVKAERLAALLEARLEHGLPWFEAYLSYDNARLPEALIRAGMVLHDGRLTRLGLDALGWLCAKQTAPSGCFRPVPTEDFGRDLEAGGLFDQQPLEAWATVDACASALEAGGGDRFRDEADRAYDWYFGGNDLGVPLVDAGDGESFDGLTWAGANQNQGAESVLAFQLATCTLATLSRASRTRFSVGDR